MRTTPAAAADAGTRRGSDRPLAAPGARAVRRRRLLIAAAGLAGLVAAGAALERPLADLEVTRIRLGAVPVTIHARRGAPPGPAVVIAHGFAGSQQLMQPFAVTLARNGYVTLTFDFPGHGRNPMPLRGGLADTRARIAALRAALATVVDHARGLADGRGLALVGHSMASDIVLRHALDDPDVRATVAVSVFSPAPTPTGPRNLLVIDGRLEPAALIDEARRIVGQGAGVPAREGVTYGSFAEGTARRLVLADGVEHIGVLYSGQGLQAALEWLDRSFARDGGGGGVVRRGPWLVLLFASLLALAGSLAGRLPRVSHPPAGAGLRWRELVAVALPPAVLAPVLLRPLPTDILPLLLGDYLALHFAAVGLLMAAGLRFLVRPAARSAPAPRSAAALAACIVLVAAAALIAFGIPLDRYFACFLPGEGRAALVAPLFAGLLPWFLVDEWCTRGVGAARGGYSFTKACFVLSLAIAVALNLRELFFLVIIVPAIIAMFGMFGLLSGWVYRRTGHPAVAATANAFVFAWAIAATFPRVA